MHLLYCCHPADAPVVHQSYCLSTSAYPYEGDAPSPDLARGNITCLSDDALVDPLNLRPSTADHQPPPTANCLGSDAAAVPNRQQQSLDTGPAPRVHLPANCSMAEVRLFGLPATFFSSTTRPLVPPTAEASAAGGSLLGGKRKRVQRGSGAPSEDAEGGRPLMGGIPLPFLASIAEAYVEGGWQTYSYGDEYWWVGEGGVTMLCRNLHVAVPTHLCPASSTRMA